jgi:HPt (histidine-containing phosphotransfer) domain-containing protein
MGLLNTMTTPAVDAETVAALKDLNPDDPNFLRELIDMFMQDVPERMAELEQALAKQDAVLLTRAAHTIKGSSSNFGAAGLVKVALEMEHQGKKADFAGATAALPGLKAEFALVAEALKTFR